jgi:hypothetical protein
VLARSSVETQSAVSTYHLKTDDATTDDGHLLGDLSESQSTSAGDDALLVNVQAREAGSFGAGGNDDVLSAQGLLTTLVERDLNGVGINKRTGTLDVVDAVLLEQELNTLGQTVNRCILRLHHLGKVELDIADLDTTLLGVVKNLVVEMGVVEERLGRDTADVQAGTAELSALLDTCGLPGCSVSMRIETEMST